MSSGWDVEAAKAAVRALVASAEGISDDEERLKAMHLLVKVFQGGEDAAADGRELAGRALRAADIDRWSYRQLGLAVGAEASKASSTGQAIVRRQRKVRGR